MIKIDYTKYSIEPILGIEPWNEEDTIDIEVDTIHAFYAVNPKSNNFSSISHNSAHIALLNIDHPDIEAFITTKQGDEDKKLSQFNISVKITDKFMKHVEEDLDWDLVFDGKVVRTVKARELFEKLIKNAYTHNDPGVFFVDRVERDNNAPWAFKLDRCNPSLRKSTKVLTRKGIFPIEELEEQSFEVRNLNQQWSPAICKLSGKNKPLYKIVFEDDTEVFCTSEHKWPVATLNGGYGKVETQNLLEGNFVAYADSRLLELSSPSDLSRDRGFLLGWLYGDGWFTYSTNNVPSYGFCFNAAEKYLGEKVLNTLNEIKVSSDSTLNFRNGMFYIDGTSHKSLRSFIQDRCGTFSKEHLPSIIWTAGDDFISGFLDGLFSADSHVCFSPKVRRGELVLTNKNKTLLLELQELLGFYGLRSKVSSRVVLGKKAFPQVEACQNKEYNSNTLRLNFFYAQKFGKLFTLSHRRKQNILNKLVDYDYKGSQFSNIRAKNIKIKSIELTSFQEDVWDISVNDTTHCFQLSSSITGNCGEIPMPSYNLCCLGALNLTKFIRNPFEDTCYFDFEKMEEVITIAVRFLDDVLDATQYPLEKIEKLSKQWRRIGLGFTGLGDAIAMLRMKYGERESIEFCQKLGKNLRDESYRSSILLAKEKGAAPGLRLGLFKNKIDPRLVEESTFIQRLPMDLQIDISKYGLRNIGCNTVAPTGCLIPSTKIQTSKGILSIEEIFALNGYDLSKIKDENGTWYIPSEELLVNTIKGEKRIIKLFVNGDKDTIKINDGMIEGTEDHKILVKRSGKVLWIPLNEITLDDLILVKKE